MCIHYMLNVITFSLGELRKLGWAGIPGDLRPMAWQLLLVSLSPSFLSASFLSCFNYSCISILQGYLPLPTSLRSITLKRKRGEYQNMVDLAFARGREGLDQQIWHQIEIDVPRTRPGVSLWMHGTTQRVRPA